MSEYRTLVAILCHQNPDQVSLILERWKPVLKETDKLLLVHGGGREDYTRLEYPEKVFIDDARLRTKDHTREKQGYMEVLKKIAEVAGRDGFDRVLFAEYDVLPLRTDLLQLLKERMLLEHSDVLMLCLNRVDGTNWHHCLSEQSDPRFLPYLKSISLREDKHAVMSMLGCLHYWKVETLFDVVLQKEPYPIYFEILVPTLAHHRGWRIRDMLDQSPHQDWKSKSSLQIRHAAEKGAWFTHAVKDLGITSHIAT